jgi:hypothetical protein
MKTVKGMLPALSLLQTQTTWTPLTLLIAQHLKFPGWVASLSFLFLSGYTPQPPPHPHHPQD